MIKENLYQFSRYPTPDKNRVPFGHTSEHLPCERNVSQWDTKRSVSGSVYYTNEALCIWIASSQNRI